MTVEISFAGTPLTLEHKEEKILYKLKEEKGGTNLNRGKDRRNEFL